MKTGLLTEYSPEYEAGTYPARWRDDMAYPEALIDGVWWLLKHERMAAAICWDAEAQPEPESCICVGPRSRFCRGHGSEL